LNGRGPPVLVTIAIIILIAIVRQYSKTFAAIAATCLSIFRSVCGLSTLAPTIIRKRWPVQPGRAAKPFPTVVFLIVAWQLSKNGYSLMATIALGYLAWVFCLGLVFLGARC